MEDLAVYIHWPYCERICPYCDFNVYRNRDVDADRWTSALIGTIAAWRQRTGPRRLASIYFGGGTPSLAPTETIARVIDACRTEWEPTEDVEITLEANPTDAERARFDAFRNAGVNRLSLGVQSFDDDALRLLGRNHGRIEARNALDAALEAFEHVTFDLIYALPGQTSADWRAALREALSIGAPHLSAYQLTIEQGTAFQKAVARGDWRPPDGDASADLFDITQDETARAGLVAYEVSNHAREGRQSRHNLAYWRGRDYLGVGPGAHGRLTENGARVATETLRRPEVYLAATEKDGLGLCVDEALSPEDALAERVTMGLRTTEGVRLTSSDDQRLANRIAPLQGEGLLVRRDDALIATPTGRRVLNAVAAALLA
ncbi:MAG: radical SAM family heme chaperone HemW [Pseudomonadota bacterium]